MPCPPNSGENSQYFIIRHDANYKDFIVVFSDKESSFTFLVCWGYLLYLSVEFCHIIFYILFYHITNCFLFLPLFLDPLCFHWFFFSCWVFTHMKQEPAQWGGKRKSLRKYRGIFIWSQEEQGLSKCQSQEMNYKGKEWLTWLHKSHKHL